MDLKGSIDFKVYLKKEEDYIIRRFAISNEYSDNLQYFLNKIISVFPELSSRQFSVTWNDSEDMVHISSDDELVLALKEMKEPLKKIYVKLLDSKISDKSDNNLFNGSARERVRNIHLAECRAHLAARRHNFYKNKLQSSEKPHKNEEVETKLTKVIPPKPHQNEEVETKLTKVIPPKPHQNEEVKTKLTKVIPPKPHQNEEVKTNFQMNASTSSGEPRKSEEVETKLPKEDFDFFNCIEILNNNAEKIRLHLIKSNGDVSENFTKTKLQALQWTLKKFQCITDKLKDESNHDSKSIEFHSNSNQVENEAVVDVTEMFRSWLSNDNQVAGMAKSETGNSSIMNETASGFSSNTFYEACSDDEGDKWTLLENEAQADSLPNVGDRLAALKCEVTQNNVTNTPIYEVENATSLTPVPQDPFQSVDSLKTVVNNVTINQQQNVPTLPVVANPLTADQDTITERRAISPHIAAGLEILYSMGFSSEKHNLVNLLESFDGNVELVLDVLIFNTQ